MKWHVGKYRESEGERESEKERERERAREREKRDREREREKKKRDDVREECRKIGIMDHSGPTYAGTYKLVGPMSHMDHCRFAPLCSPIRQSKYSLREPEGLKVN